MVYYWVTAIRTAPEKAVQVTIWVENIHRQWFVVQKQNLTCAAGRSVYSCCEEIESFHRRSGKDRKR